MTFSNTLSQLSFEEINELDDIDLFKKLGVSNKKSPKHLKPRPDWNYVYKEKQKRHVSLELLCHEYREEYGKKSMSYNRFCELFKKYVNSLNIAKRMIYKAGDMVQVDFAGTTVPIHQADCTVIKAQIFIGVLPASGYIFAYAVQSQRIECWLRCHAMMFKYFGGVTNYVIPDNLKSAVQTNNYDKIVLTSSYQQFCYDYGCIVLPARPGQPRDKGLGESAVKTVETRIIAKFRNRKFFSMKDLNVAIEKELVILNKRKTNTYPRGRKVDFLEIDKPALNPLPNRDYEPFIFIAKVKVNKYYMVIVEDCEYSVPYQYTGQKVDIRHTQSLVEVFYKNKLITTHAKKKDQKCVIKPEHLHPDHRIYEELRPEGLLKWAETISESAYLIFEENLKKKSDYANSLRRLQNFKKWLIENRDDFDMLAGIDYAVCLNIYSLERLKSILKNKAYLRTEERKKCVTKSHENLRGGDYFEKIEETTGGA